MKCGKFGFLKAMRAGSWDRLFFFFGLSKIDIFLVKMHDFLATLLFTETIPQGVLIIIEGGKVHYITKQKEKMCLPWQVDL